MNKFAEFSFLVLFDKKYVYAKSINGAVQFQKYVYKL